MQVGVKYSFKIEDFKPQACELVQTAVKLPLGYSWDVKLYYDELHITAVEDKPETDEVSNEPV